jgi:NAD(P)-dependent dehydrogenase (short-subunit alcohol dehydrogenase family)
VNASVPLRVIVTGSSSGIGNALVRRLIARGHLVWGLARSSQAGLVSSLGSDFQASQCDVAVWSEVESAAKMISSVWPTVDGLVTCAGIQGEVGRALASDPSRWSATVRTNLDGTYNVLRAFAPLFENVTRRAKIVCFSGGGATKSRPNFSAYGVAKTGVVRLVETIAEEERGRPIDINTIAPGSINTRLTDEIITLGPKIAGEAEYQAALKQREKGGSNLDKALDLVEWLLSPASDGISGRLLSAPWDSWLRLDQQATVLAGSDIYTLRRILPEDRGKNF